jgi:hypothetical protein
VRTVKRSAWLVLAVLFALLLPAAGCPVNPGPAGTGGATGTGGSVATGGADFAGESARSGAPSATGGSRATGGAATTGGAPTVAWPACLPDGARQAPAVRGPLGRKRSQTTRRHLASYVDQGWPDVFWEPSRPAPEGERFAEPLDQGNLGKCTCEGALGLLTTRPNIWRGTPEPGGLELISDSLYRWATRHDPFLTPTPGYWEPVDTGSNGESALNAAVALGYLPAENFIEVSSFEELQWALQKGPCMIGMNWPAGFDSPDRCGAVKKTGAIRGGHEVIIVGSRKETKQDLARNSWGRKYGRDGYFWMTWGTVAEMLAAGGDAHCLKYPIALPPANDNASPWRVAL